MADEHKYRLRLDLANDRLECYRSGTSSWIPARLSEWGTPSKTEIIFYTLEIEKAEVISYDKYYLMIIDDVPFVLRWKSRK